MSIKDTELIKVQNLTDHSVVYYSYTGQRRAFEGQQVLPITAGEIRQLNYTRGGRNLLHGYLAVKNKELAIELGIDEEDFDAEYSWTVEDVDNLLNNGSIEELEDALDFGPEGIVETIIDRAVILRLADINKRKIIQEFTQKDVDKMIEQVEVAEKALENNDGMVHRIGENTKKQRRVKKTDTQKKRRVVKPKVDSTEE